MTRSVVAHDGQPTSRWSVSRYEGSRLSLRNCSSVSGSSGRPHEGQGGTKNEREGLS